MPLVLVHSLLPLLLVQLLQQRNGNANSNACDTYHIMHGKPPLLYLFSDWHLGTLNSPAWVS